VCAQACKEHAGCHAFTFITVEDLDKHKKRCWLKGRKYYLGAEFSTGTLSGILRPVSA